MILIIQLIDHMINIPIIEASSSLMLSVQTQIHLGNNTLLFS
jgi:hypothetical protein